MATIRRPIRCFTTGRIATTTGAWLATAPRWLSPRKATGQPARAFPRFPAAGLLLADPWRRLRSYRHVFTLGTHHCDPLAINHTLGETLMWLWADG